MATISIETFFDLARELASRSEDETTGSAFVDKWFFAILGDASGWSFCLFFESFCESLDDRKGECCCLSCTCLSTAKEIKSSENHGDRFFLYGCRIRISLFFEGFEDWLYELEFGE